MYKFLLLIWFLFGLTVIVKAQTDTLSAKSKTDSVVKKRDSIAAKPFMPKITKEKEYHPDTLHNPHKAVMRSLMIPGWGQIYNHQWWKVPFIYGGLGLLADVVVFNQRNYKIFLKQAELLQRGAPVSQQNPALVGISQADITTYTDIYRRDRDLGILGFIGGWGIQMVEAYVSAKFIRSYTMDNNLSFKVSPSMIGGQSGYAFNSYNTLAPAVKITFTLK